MSYSYQHNKQYVVVEDLRYGKFEAMILSKKIAFFREFCIIGKVV